MIWLEFWKLHYPDGFNRYKKSTLASPSSSTPHIGHVEGFSLSPGSHLLLHQIPPSASHRDGVCGILDGILGIKDGFGEFLSRMV